MEFTPMTASIFQEPTLQEEMIVSKQSVLSGYATELRKILNQLPTEITREILGPYREPSARLTSKISKAILEKEFLIDAAEIPELDQEWAQGASPRALDEAGLGADDDWNRP